MSPEMMLARALATKQFEVEKTASVEESEDRSLVAAMDKLAWAEEAGRELAREHMQKVAVTLPSMAGIQKGVGSAIHATMGASKGMRAGVGAAGGAALGGVAGAMKDPGVNQQTGQKNSRLGNIAGGMALGGAAGGAAGLGAKRGLQMAAGSKGAVGQGLRETMGMGNRNAKDAMRTHGLNTLANKGFNPKSAQGMAAASKAAPAPAAPAPAAPGGAPAPASPMTGEQARKATQQSLWARGKQALGVEAVPDSVAQGKAALKGFGVHASVNPDRVDPEVLYKLMLERTGRS